MFTKIFIVPLYNVLIFLVDVVPLHDVGLAIITLTVLVKLALSPLNRKAVMSQIQLKSLEPKIKEIKKNYPDKQEQAAKTFELYKEYKISPLAGCLPILIQLPIILALYRVFLSGFSLDAHPIYSFVTRPEIFRMEFLGLIDLASKSLGFAILAGATQFLQGYFSAARTTAATDPNDTSMQANMSRMMGKQMKYFLPIFVAIVSYQISAAIALYWSVNNIFTTVQEILIQKRLKKMKDLEPRSLDVARNK